MYNLIFLVQDSVKVDTTLLQYKIGTHIGDWLPFALFVLVYILIIKRRYRFKDK